VDAIRQRNWAAVGRELFNRLEEPAFEMYTDLAELKGALAGVEALGALLSGSGSTLYAMTSPDAAAGVETRIREKLRSGASLVTGPVPGWRRE
jgi:4-diphosphocytidyl-2-C-methyl-D-erythritol kinase